MAPEGLRVVQEASDLPETGTQKEQQYVIDLISDSDDEPVTPEPVQQHPKPNPADMDSAIFPTGPAVSPLEAVAGEQPGGSETHQHMQGLSTEQTVAAHQIHPESYADGTAGDAQTNSGRRSGEETPQLHTPGSVVSPATVAGSQGATLQTVSFGPANLSGSQQVFEMQPSSSARSLPETEVLQASDYEVENEELSSEQKPPLADGLQSGTKSHTQAEQPERALHDTAAGGSDAQAPSPCGFSIPGQTRADLSLSEMRRDDSGAGISLSLGSELGHDLMVFAGLASLDLEPPPVMKRSVWSAASLCDAADPLQTEQLPEPTLLPPGPPQEESEERKTAHHYLIGRRIKKVFPKVSNVPFQGVIDSWDPVVNWFHVTYDDGDEEELGPMEVGKLLIPDRAEKKQRRLKTERTKRFLSSSKRKSAHRICEDISNGEESIKIPVYNEVDGEPAPEFRYVRQTVISDPRLKARILEAAKHKDRLVGSPLPNKPITKARDAYINCAKNRVPLLSESTPYGLLEDGAERKHRVVSQGLRLPLEVFKTRDRGWGLRCLKDIPVGRFVVDYTGELITEETANKLKGNDSYLFTLDHFHLLYKSELDTMEGVPRSTCPATQENPPVINAEKIGNVARFINHSRRGNCLPICVITDETHSTIFYKLCLFASTDIAAGEELTYDYGGEYMYEGKAPDWLTDGPGEDISEEERPGEGQPHAGPGVSLNGAAVHSRAAGGQEAEANGFAPPMDTDEDRLVAKRPAPFEHLDEEAARRTKAKSTLSPSAAPQGAAPRNDPSLASTSGTANSLPRGVSISRANEQKRYRADVRVVTSTRTTPTVYLGSYNTPEEAVRAWDAGALAYFGPGVATTNYPYTDYYPGLLHGPRAHCLQRSESRGKAGVHFGTDVPADISAALVGRQLSILWQEMHTFYAGTIERYIPESRMFKVRYDCMLGIDNDTKSTEWLYLWNETVEWLPKLPSGGSPSCGPTHCQRQAQYSLVESTCWTLEGAKWFGPHPKGETFSTSIDGELTTGTLTGVMMVTVWTGSSPTSCHKELRYLVMYDSGRQEMLGEDQVHAALSAPEPPAATSWFPVAPCLG